MELICPICGNTLTQLDKRFVCENRHSFDIARQGYVHLLPVQQKHSIAPGDTREQVLSRRSFLEQGHYAPIAQALIAAAKKYEVSGEILDVGCGEGYYSTRIADRGYFVSGFDLSKEAVIAASKRATRQKCQSAFFGVASVYELPLFDESADAVVNISREILKELRK